MNGWVGGREDGWANEFWVTVMMSVTFPVLKL